MVIVRLPLLVSAVLLASVDLVGAQGRSSASGTQAAYNAAIRDAMVAEPSEISEHLTPVLRGRGETRWKEIDGEDYVLTVTWTSWGGYDDQIRLELEREVWITLVPQIGDRCSDFGVRELDLRLEQLLGLPPSDGNTKFVEMWVKPDDLFRPCPDPEIDDSRCELDFPDGTNAEHMQWFNHLRATSYGDDGYPWTRLGYTYDWGSSSGEVGLSEYLIREGATIRVRSIDSTVTYCQGQVP